MSHPLDLAASDRGLELTRAHTRGGHFAALEQPTLLADDVQGFFASLR